MPSPCAPEHPQACRSDAECVRVTARIRRDEPAWNRSGAFLRAARSLPAPPGGRGECYSFRAKTQITPPWGTKVLVPRSASIRNGVGQRVIVRVGSGQGEPTFWPVAAGLLSQCLPRRGLFRAVSS